MAVAAVCAALGWLAHRSVAAAKRAGDWYAGTRQAVAADTSLRTDPVRPQWMILVPGVVLFAATALIGAWRYTDLPATLPTPDGLVVDATRRTATTVGFAFATVSAQLLILLLVGLLALAIPRGRPEIDAERPAGSAARYRRYLGAVLRLLFASAGCANVSLLVAWSVFAVRAGDAGHRLSTSDDEEPTGRVQRDDDRFWFAAGMVYANRTDPALFVHRRSGAFWTLNLGNPLSWAIVAVVAVVAVLTGFGVIDLPERGG